MFCEIPVPLSAPCIPPILAWLMLLVAAAWEVYLKLLSLRLKRSFPLAFFSFNFFSTKKKRKREREKTSDKMSRVIEIKSD